MDTKSFPTLRYDGTLAVQCSIGAIVAGKLVQTLKLTFATPSDAAVCTEHMNINDKEDDEAHSGPKRQLTVTAQDMD